MKKKIALLLAAMLLLSACGENAAGSASVSAPASTVSSTETGEISANLEQLPNTEIALNGGSISVSGPGAKVDGATVTITQAGQFTISGKLDDGQILVDAGKEDAVYLVLSGADITCSTGAPIYGLQSETIFIETAADTENTVTDGENYVLAAGEDEPDAAIFSKDDLVLHGEGALTVTGNYSTAVRSKDNLMVAGGTYHVTSVGDGLKGKDDVTITSGSVTIDAGEDGIQATNSKNLSLGGVSINNAEVHVTAGKDGIKAESVVAVLGGDVSVTAQEDGINSAVTAHIHDGSSLTIDAQQDGIQGDSTVIISGGTIDITTGGGTENAPEHTEEFGFGGWFNAGSDDSSASAKGLKSDGDITVSGGTLQLDCMDDALHCGGVLTISEGADLTIATGDDGIHSDDTLNIEGGKINITRSYEGLEAVFINISGGETTLIASDDGLNAAGGSSADTDFSFTGPPGMDGQAETLEDATYYVNITGGKLTMDAGGDGLDSNGALFVSGGEIIVSGPSDSMNGALDYTTTGQITGGTLIAAGASAMAQNFDSSSTQCSLMYTFTANMEAGSTVTLTDSSGTVLLEAAMAKSFNNVVISTPDLAIGETYTISCGDETTEIEVTGLITSAGTQAFGGLGGDLGGRPGRSPGGGMPFQP